MFQRSTTAEGRRDSTAVRGESGAMDMPVDGAHCSKNSAFLIVTLVRMGFLVTQHPGVILAPVSNPSPTLLAEPINSALAHLAGLWCSSDFGLSGGYFLE